MKKIINNIWGFFFMILIPSLAIAAAAYYLYFRATVK